MQPVCARALYSCIDMPFLNKMSSPARKLFFGRPGKPGKYIMLRPISPWPPQMPVEYEEFKYGGGFPGIDPQMSTTECRTTSSAPPRRKKERKAFTKKRARQFKCVARATGDPFFKCPYDSKNLKHVVTDVP